MLNNKDKDHFYTYSLYGLSFNFPLFERDRNEEYHKYIENKSKWLIKNKDFDRYKQPEREKFYFPKINNIFCSSHIGKAPEPQAGSRILILYKASVNITVTH